MRRLFAVAALIVALGACATTPLPPQPRAEPNLDVLFARLQTAASPGEAERIEALILEAWSRSGNPAVDGLMAEGIRALYRGDHRRALTIFNDVVKAAPGFAEGWRWRGITLHAAGDSLAGVVDLRRALALEPRHFGAWLALARMFEALEAPDQAMYAYRMALSLDPHLNEARQRLRDLEERAAGLPI